MGFKEAFTRKDITQEELDMITKKANQPLLDKGYSQEVIDDAYSAMELDYMGLPNFVSRPSMDQYLEVEYPESKHAKYDPRTGLLKPHNLVLSWLKDNYDLTTDAPLAEILMLLDKFFLSGSEAYDAYQSLESTQDDLEVMRDFIQWALSMENKKGE